MTKTIKVTLMDWDEYDYDLIIEAKSPTVFDYWKEGCDGQKLTDRPINLGASINGQVKQIVAGLF